MLMNPIHVKNKHLFLKKKLIIMLRGHIRQSFESETLYQFIKILMEMYDVRIYIHTWNILQSNISWRDMERDETNVTPSKIYEYFKDCPIHYIKIDNDKEIKLIGNLSGTVTNKSPMPIVGWKNMWYGMYSNINKIKKEINNKSIPIVNLRFDLFDIFKNKLNYISVDMAVQFIENNYIKKYEKNKFIYERVKAGIDNIIIGNINTMYNLISHFYYDLDKIVIRYKNIVSQEFIVFLENNKIDRLLI
jgi:hypothetical protein